MPKYTYSYMTPRCWSCLGGMGCWQVGGCNKNAGKFLCPSLTSEYPARTHDFHHYEISLVRPWPAPTCLQDYEKFQGTLSTPASLAGSISPAHIPNHPGEESEGRGRGKNARYSLPPHHPPPLPPASSILGIPVRIVMKLDLGWWCGERSLIPRRPSIAPYI